MRMTDQCDFHNNTCWHMLVGNGGQRNSVALICADDEFAELHLVFSISVRQSGVPSCAEHVCLLLLMIFVCGLSLLLFEH